MKPRIDSYTLFARTLPILILVSPIVLLLIAILPDGFKLTLGAAAGLAFVLLSFFLGQVGADFGKKNEPQLWRKWGGPPTTRFLRHSNGEFNSITRQRIHEKMRLLGLHVPCQEEEAAEPSQADRYFESCVEELIRRTRDQQLFPLVFEALTGYGFRRNLLGLRWLGLVLTCGALIGSVWLTVAAWEGNHGSPVVALAVTLVNAGLLSIWALWVSERTVRLSADRYARFLLEAALNLE